MKDDIENILLENKKCFDRFTFDKIFKELLRQNYSHDEAKEIIFFNCSLSTLVFQERFENNFYKDISLFKESSDLIKLKNDMLSVILEEKLTDIIQ